jgi:hypothetical protein
MTVRRHVAHVLRISARYVQNAREREMVVSTDLMRVQLLDWLYDFRPDNPGEYATIVDFLDPDVRTDGHQHLLWLGVVRDLESDGLVLNASGMGLEGLSAMITAAGRRDVEARRIRRADRAQRNAAIRQAVIRYVHDRSRASDLEPLLDNHHFEGERLTQRDLDDALQYLLDKDLVRGVDVAEAILINIELTDRGVDCAEHFGGSVSDFLSRERSGGTQINIHGDNYGPMAWDSQQITQTVTTTATATAGDELAVLARAIREALPVLDMQEADRAKVETQLQTVEEELAGDEPDQGIVGGMLKRTVTTIGSVADSSLALLLTAWAKDLMQRAHLLPPS